MVAERLMPTQESADLIDLTRTIVARELAPTSPSTSRVASSPARSSAPSAVSGC